MRTSSAVVSKSTSIGPKAPGCDDEISLYISRWYYKKKDRHIVVNGLSSVKFVRVSLLKKPGIAISVFSIDSLLDSNCEVGAALIAIEPAVDVELLYSFVQEL